MAPDELQDALAVLHWSQRGLAGILDVHPTTVRRWAAGTQAIPEPVSGWLEDLALYVAHRRLPDGWTYPAP